MNSDEHMRGEWDLSRRFDYRTSETNNSFAGCLLLIMEVIDGPKYGLV